jgi:hypothetical protein
MHERELTAIEKRAAAATGDRWAPGSDAGAPVIRAEFDDGREEIIRVTRERSPAAEDDVQFIARARGDLMRIVAHLRGTSPLGDEELDVIQARYLRATPGPWRAAIEADGGLGGCDVISVSNDEREADMYLWIRGDLAPSADFRFVGAARQDLPKLVEAARRLRQTKDA